jgi:GTP-binding protein
MFIDEAEIYVKAGNGGDGAVSFRREKYIPDGGPDGGDGGRGGNIIFVVNNQAHGLAVYNRQKRFLAENGVNGGTSKKSGKNGEHLTLRVPAGTQIYHHDQLLFDLTKGDEEIVYLKGGNGGWGNQHFATSIKQAPKWSKKGLRGESARIKLVLKTIADIGLIGEPNAGKSTLLASITSAKPKIADYPFTTLAPNLGTFIDKDTRIVIADIPGLIEGASTGKGLGDKFLRHIERTKTLVHVITALSADPYADYQTVRKELADFSAELLQKPEIVVLNKIDALSSKEVNDKIADLLEHNIKAIPISAVSGAGKSELINAIKQSIFR